MYFSHDYETYYVTLFRYDFSQISYREFVIHPDIYRAQLSFLPLNDIENIYENIRFSFSNLNQGLSKTTSNYELPTGLQRLQDLPCAVTMNVPGQVCKGSGEVKHVHGEECSMSGSDRATPGYTYIDTRDCYGAPGSGAPDGHGGGGSVGSPGGGGTGGGAPVRSVPIRCPGDFIDIGDVVVLNPNIGSFDTNQQTLKNLVKNNKSYIQTLHTNSDDTREHGYAFTKQKINGAYTPWVNPVSLQLASANNWQLNINVALKNSIHIGILHTHTNPNTEIYEHNTATKAAPMFSGTDIQALFHLSSANTNINKKLSEVFLGLITSESMYVLMFPNDATLDNFGVKYGRAMFTIRRDTDVWEKIGNELRKEYEKITQPTAIDYEKALLKVL